MSGAIFAIDPGTTHSGWVLMRDGLPFAHGVDENAVVQSMMPPWPVSIAIEMIASYGMAVGSEVFETCVWIGRFIERAGPARVRRVYRKDVKQHLCGGHPKAKDTNIRQALIDKFGNGGGKAVAVGTVKQPGPLYGIKSHAWAALAVAVTAAETRA